MDVDSAQNEGKEIRGKDSFGGAGIFILSQFQKIPAAPPESVPLFLPGVVPLHSTSKLQIPNFASAILLTPHLSSADKPFKHQINKGNKAKAICL
ncbi:hypothetical protein GCM10008022_28680 [Paenibacillus hunanensis]|nr:hypothetical protein GCM10008022_28680 [Paenibacillus hunanensis]